MNLNKISFILCSNDEFLAQECELYLQQLTIPKGYIAEVLVVQDAKSMCAGYNEAMQSSDAKYKIYWGKQY